MDPKDDLIYKHQSDQLDRELRDKYRGLNIWREIGSKKDSDSDEDRQNLISGRLMKAEKMLENAAKDKGSYSDAIDFVNDEILELEPGNATALTIRAIAHSHFSMFADAVNDAEAAIRAEPKDDFRMGQWMRSQLPTWRKHAERYGV